jgi:gliding motility-associated-like protein
VAYTLQVVPFEEQFTGGSIPPCHDTMNGLVWLFPQDNTGIEYDYYWYDMDNTLLQTTINSVDGDTFSSAVAGVYTVKVVNPDGCRKFYNLVVSPPTYEVGINVNDTIACTGIPIIFNTNNSSDIETWTWDFGDGTPLVPNQQITTHAYGEEGVYTITLTGYTVLGCMDTASIQIVVDAPQDVTIIADKDSVCVGERINLTGSAGNHVDTLYWDFGNSWQISYPGEGPVSYVYETPGVFDVKLNAAYRACPDKMAQTTISVFPYPVVNLGNDTSLCLNGHPIILYNLVSQSEAYTSLWNTGDTTAFLEVVHPGTYSLTVAARDVVCKTTDEIVVKKACYLDIPNSFTPNGDGVNDYFFPRQLLGANISVFHMQIFDRWGQLVFETNRIDGRGWDGKLNGKDQPVGVYIYQISAVINGDHQENYTGNVSLLR